MVFVLIEVTWTSLKKNFYGWFLRFEANRHPTNGPMVEECGEI